MHDKSSCLGAGRPPIGMTGIRSQGQLLSVGDVSEHTVQDHLKSIFAKTAARNRRILLAAPWALDRSRDPAKRGLAPASRDERHIGGGRGPWRVAS